MKRVKWVSAFLIMLAVADIIFVVFCSVFVPIKFQRFVGYASAEFGVDRKIIYAVINTESGFKRGAVSRVGAVGLMQVMPQTANWIALELDEDNFDLTDPQTNIRFGTFYLSYFLEKYGDLSTALACYNAGETISRTWMIEGKDGALILDASKITYPETATYIKKVQRSLKLYQLSIF